jgi:hypothetical protein
VRYVDEGFNICEGIDRPHWSTVTFLHRVSTYTGISNTVHRACVCVCGGGFDVQMRMSTHVHVKFQITEI